MDSNLQSKTDGCNRKYRYTAKESTEMLLQFKEFPEETLMLLIFLRSIASINVLHLNLKFHLQRVGSN